MRAVERFLVVAVLLVVFLGVGLTVVLDVVFAATLLGVLVELLLAVVFAAVLLTVRAAGFAVDAAELRVVTGAADASIKGFVFFDGSVARTCLIALACSSSVILNSWWPSLLATK